MSSTNLLILRDKVQRYSKQLFETVSLDEDGDLLIPFGSTVLHVNVGEFENMSENFQKWREDNDISTTYVQVWAITLYDVEPTADLYKWVATEGQTKDYGTFRVVHQSAPSKNANLVFSYSLAGDTLDPGELKNALALVAFVVDDYDDELKPRFGGKTTQDAINGNS